MPARDVAIDDYRPRVLCAFADHRTRVCQISALPAEDVESAVRRARLRSRALARVRGLDTQPAFLAYIPPGADAALRAELEAASWAMALTVRGWLVPDFVPAAVAPSLAREGWRNAQELRITGARKNA